MFTRKVSTRMRQPVHTSYQSGLVSARRNTVICLLVCGLLAGCSMVDKLAEFGRSASEPAPRPDQPPPASRPVPPVTILLSDDLPAYSGVADELATRLTTRPEIINLHGNSNRQALAQRFSRQSGKQRIVAIGPLAAHTAVQLGAGEVVFCQVFNYHELGAGAKHVQGVSFLPPAEPQFRAWKKLDPGLRRVGVITGPGHEKLISEARKAAQHHGIELIHHTVLTDMEMLYDFKRLTPEIQGLWLLPDDRILSRRVLREIMSYSTRHRQDVVVFHPELLRYGGLMSVSSVDADVAGQVIAALRTTSRRSTAKSKNVLPLKQIHIVVNPRVAQSKAGVAVPEPRVAADAR